MESEFFPVNSLLRWLRELNAMQIKKIHANRKKQIKLMTHSLQKVTTQHKYRNDNNGTKHRTTTSIDEGVFWACVVSFCSALQVVFLICSVLSSLGSSHLSLTSFHRGQGIVVRKGDDVPIAPRVFTSHLPCSSLIHETLNACDWNMNMKSVVIEFTSGTFNHFINCYKF